MHTGIVPEHCISPDAPLFMAGDDSGVIKLWDSRQSEAVASFDAHQEFVSDLALHDQDHCLLSVSGDGTLSVIDLKLNKVWRSGVECTPLRWTPCPQSASHTLQCVVADRRVLQSGDCIRHVPRT